MKAMNMLIRFLVAISELFSPTHWALMLTKSQLTSLLEFIEDNTFIKDAYDALVPLGIGIALLFFINNLMTQAMTKDLIIDDFVRDIIKFCFTSIVIKNGYKLLTGIVDLGSYITAIYVNEIAIVEETSAISNYTLEDFMDLLAQLLSLPTHLILLVLFSIAICSVMLVRTVEVVIYTVIAPLAMADFTVSNIESSNAFRFLKMYAALTIQGLIMAGAIYIGNLFDSSTAFNIATGSSLLIGLKAGIPKVGLFSLLNSDTLFGLFIIFMIFKSKSIAKDIVGI